EKESRPVEVRIPNHFRDILNVISCDFIGSNTSFAPHILKYYIYGLSKNKISSRKLPSYLNSDLAKGVADKRISLKGRDIISHIDILKTTTKIDKTTDIIKSVILKTKYDILDNNRQKPIKALKGIAAAIS
ncbi:MAG: hypothetical protein GY756_15390, partial [bacterium]|nr:hypothetical protein [bacterium]